MVGVRDHQQVKILVRPDQSIDDKQRIIRRDVVVHCPVGEQKVALQILGVFLVSLFFVIVAREQTDVAFSPVVLVISVVVIAGFGNANLKEIGIAKHRRRGRKTAARVSPNANAGCVDIWVFCCQFLDSRDLIGQRVIAHVAIAQIVKLL